MDRLRKVGREGQVGRCFECKYLVISNIKYQNDKCNNKMEGLGITNQEWQVGKWEGAMKIKNQAGRGFTLLEVLAVLAVIGFMVTVVSVFANRNFGNYSLQQAINDMDKIKTSIRDGFYRDTWLIPQSTGKLIDGEDHPEFATKYLCLKNDCEPGDIRNATYTKEWKSGRPKLEGAKIHFDYVKCDELCSGSCELKKLCRFFYVMTKNDWDIYPEDGTMKRVLLYDPGFKQGWNGPYIEGNAMIMDQAGDYVPVIATPWAADIEQIAREAKEEGDKSLAEKYRKGKYYHIRVEWIEKRYVSPWPEILHYQEGKGAVARMRNGIRQDKTTARIICYGENGLDDGSYCRKYDDEGNCKEGRETTIEELKDPDFDIGDDLVMFIFGDGVTRVPLER